METQDHMADPAAVRDGHGRWRPGVSGNPKGKAPGTVHEKSLIKRALREGEADQIARAMIDKAIGGNLTATRFVADRIDPKPRGRQIEFVVDDNTDPGELIDATLRGLMNGEVTLDEAHGVLRFLTASRALLLEIAAVKEAARAEALAGLTASAEPAAASTPEVPAFHLHSAGAAIPTPRRRAAPIDRATLLAGASAAALAARSTAPPLTQRDARGLSR